MSLPLSVAEVTGQHVKFELESIDRMYLNVYQPMFQTGGGVSVFFRWLAMRDGYVWSISTDVAASVPTRGCAGRGTVCAYAGQWLASRTLA